MSGNNEEECVGLAAFKRNKYFYGKLLTVRDFEDEQSYINKKRYLMNRAIHGIGLVCGLEVSNPRLEESGFKIDLSKGVAIDCCGHEIVVISQDGTKEKDVKGERKDGLNYIYLKYKEELVEPVPVPANASKCEEICCGNRILESFELEFGDKPAEPSGEAFSADDLKCPVCQEPTDPKVFLAVIKKNEEDFSIDETETKKYRSIVYTNPMLHDLLSGHLTDFKNPHKVTALQVKALMSVNEVGNAEDKEAWVGNINLESEDKTIGISPKVSDDKIDLKLHENSVDTKHIKDSAVTAAKIGNDAVIAEKIKNGAVTAAKIGNDAVVAEKIKNGAVTAAKIGNDAVVAEKIKNGAVTAEKIANGSVKDEKIAEDANINEGKIRHLSLVYENLKERSLKCIVDSFTIVYNKHGIKHALEIVENFKKALNEGYYKDDEKYIGFIADTKNLYDPAKGVGKELEGEVPEESLEGYIAAVKEVGELLGKKEIIPVEIASAVEEVCFYARWLVPPEGSPEQVKESALKCIVDSFTEIHSKLGIEYALKIAENFKNALNEGYYKDDEKYIGFIKESVKSLYELAEEIKGKVPEESFDGYITAVKMLTELTEKKEIVPVKIASAVEEVCFYAKRLGTRDYEDLKKQIESLNKEIDILTNNSIADALHRHSKLVGRDGSPDPALSVDNAGSVGIGTASPDAKLQIINIDQDAKGNTLILGPIDKSNLRLGYHSDYSWIQSHMGKPLSINPIGNNVGIGTAKPDAKLDVNGFTRSLGISVNNAANTGVGRGLWLWSPSDSNHVIYSANPTGKSPANRNAAKGYFDANHRLRLRTAAGQGFLFENNKETALVDIDSDEGRLWTRGAIYSGNSDIYFTKTDHIHSGIGNTPGYAAIENAANYGALMILGRNMGTKDQPSRTVKLYDIVEISKTLTVRTLNVTGAKKFLIDHPLDSEHKNLIHATLEGPEVAVFYRGEAQLSNGQVTIQLPDYFEALTRKENRNVLLTSKFGADAPISMLAASEVKDGRFMVKMIDGKNPSQKFYWEVKAVRADVDILEVEETKTAASEGASA